MIFSKSILDQQIDVFLHACIKRGILEGTYNFWLREFGKTYKGSAEDITENDKTEFLTRVSVLYNGQHSLNQAKTAIDNLMCYYKARGRNVAKCRGLGYNGSNSVMSHIKVDRNKDIVQKRLSDKKKWTWQALGDYHNIHFSTAKFVFDRFKDELSTG